MKKSKRINHLIRLTCLAGAVFCYSAVGYAAVMSNATLPENGNILAGGGSIGIPVNNIMNISGLDNTVIKWDSFNIGSVATVNFSGEDNFNVLNYVASGGSMSQIHGTLNAQGGNVYLVNPAGVFIGKSAQIDVGSLYVSNKKIDDDILKKGFVEAVQTLNTVQPSSAELMSLGHINATSVTFDGDRIVLDTEHLIQAIDTKMDAENINIKTSNKATADVVLGYSAYDATLDNNGKAVGYAGKNNNEVIAKVNDKDFTKANGYMWIENVEQLQAMNTNPGGNYALRNGIDATNTAEKPFEAIENFEGKLDGLAGRVEGVDFSIFDLHVGGEAAEDNQGLFANTDDATLKNLIFVSGSTQGSGQNIGTLVGSAVGGVIENVKSSSNVTGGAGSSNVGGIVGSASGVTMSDLLNTGAVQGHENVGGIVGSMAGGELKGQSYNLGNVTGIDGEKDSLKFASVWDNIGTSNDKTWTGNGNNHDEIWIKTEDGTIREATFADFKKQAEGKYVGEYIVEDIRGFAVRLVMTDQGFDEENYDSELQTTLNDIPETDDKGSILHNNIELEYMYDGTIHDTNRKNEAIAISDLVNYTPSDYSHNIGGLVGSATNNATIGDVNGPQVFNQMSVTGGYNVGGIVGNLQDSSVQNAANNGNITATGYTVGLYKFHTDNDNNYYTFITDENGVATKAFYAANAGGIVGNSNSQLGDGGNSFIKNVINTGSIATATAEYAANVDDVETKYTYYIAGNVGGIAGSAVNTAINQAENKENTVFGANNVGGIAGYLENGTINDATNNGGEIKATGGRYSNGLLKEWIRKEGAYSGNEEVIVGNAGGIVGYLYGDSASITGAGNRGTVHSEDVAEDQQPVDINRAANVGGIVGKIDRSKTIEDINTLKDEKGLLNAAVSNSYNTGDVRGYTGVGGIAGMMYNGEIAASYNLGNLRSTFNTESKFSALNMGGIVGDTTENTKAAVLLYDVYNKGQIGDEKFTYFGRHVGGVVGRLSGTVEKAYNTGAIYNASTATGGVAGWIAEGSLSNVFNTGNVTVINKNAEDSNDSAANKSNTGGIAGSVKGNSVDTITINNAYNLGTIRAFAISGVTSTATSGIVGRILNDSKVEISNVYTSGEIFAGYITEENLNNKGLASSWYNTEHAIIGDGNATVRKAYYIAPDPEKTATVVTGVDPDTQQNGKFVSLIDSNRLDGATPIAYEDRFKLSSWNDFFSNSGDSSSSWRMYSYTDDNDNTIGTTPILNAFMPTAEEYFGYKDNLDSQKINWESNNIASVQYGTAYNPMLTIVNMKDNTKDLALDWKQVGIKKSGGLAVYGSGLDITNFANATESNYYGGLIYADGALSIASDTDASLRLGSASEIYGSSVTIKNKGDIVGYGKITATGNGEKSDVNITGANVELLGQVTAAQESQQTIIDGINNTPKKIDYTDTLNPFQAMPDVAKKYAYTIEEAESSGDITISAMAADGKAQLLLGMVQNGLLSTAGSLIVSGREVYIDSDVSFGNNLTITADEAVLDISNIGKVQADENSSSVQIMHNFLKQGSNLSFKGRTDEAVTDAIIAVDMWDDAAGKFDLNQYDNKADTFAGALANFGVDNSSKIHIWLDSAEQLQSINDYYEEYNQSGILTYNFALKNDIDANSLKNFHGIGYGLGGKKNPETDSFNVAFTGNLDGRGYSIVGLSVTADSSNNDYDYDYVGLFSRIGEHGSVKDLNIISSNFTGSSVGAVAGRNEGTIENVTTFGNRVTSDGSVLTNVFGTGEHQVGAAGGITGINKGTISNVTASDAVIAGIAGVRGDDDQYIDSTAGGIAGVNVAKIKDSVANSAVTSSAGDANALGGVIGINYGSNAEADVVESLGIVNGKYKGADASEGIVVRATENIGGIAGVSYNGATISNAYNEAHISGSNGVGGIVGYSGVGSGYTGANNTITNAVNAGSIIGSSEGLTNTKAVHNTGGLVGNSQNTSINTARNTGAIHGEENVGGMVGTNGENSTLNNVTNDGSATIYGNTNVGGVAGVNEGRINAEESQLINNGTIYGNNTVGGIAGLNTGTIKNTNSNITLYATGKDAMYFGGVAGRNEGTITSATNTGDVLAENAGYVGGITGVNGTLNSDGSLEAGNSRITGAGNANSGTVTGANYVGGVAGLNAGNVSGQDANPTEIRNDGYVHATAGGAGGIFGVNEKALTNVTMINGGVVYGAGASGTGGVIGVNYGDISKSDVIGEINAVVIGKENVGGLIGKNYASVEGGRDTEENGGNYYAHQVYNNGTVVGGDYKETLAAGDSDWTAITVGSATVGYYQATETSSYIGGLVGSNDRYGKSGGSGSLTAAYSTATVMGGQYVGGIVGSSFSEAVIDQVFNAGEVKDYTGKVLNTEGSEALNGVIGISNVSGYKITNAYDIKSNAVINASEDNKDIWKTYGAGDTYGTNKLLKVFLTKIYLDPEPGANVTYNAHKQSIVVKAEKDINNKDIINVYKNDNIDASDNKLVLLGTIKTTSDDPNAAHSLADYLNTSTDALSALLSGNVLVKNGETVTSAGAYEMFASQQIITDSKNAKNTHGPNNLGFDVVSGNVDPTKPDDGNGNIINAAKATIGLTLNDVYRIYGSLDLLQQDLKTAGEYDYAITGSNLNAEMLKELKDLSVTKPVDSGKEAQDGALDNSSGEWRTRGVNNGNPYSWTLTAALSDELAKNYTFGENTGNSKEFSGNSYVTPKALNITLDEVIRTYGSAAINNNDGNYNFAVSGWAYDENFKDKLNVSVTADSALVNLDGTADVNGRVTENAGGNYSWTGAISATDADALKNYTFNATATGKSTVNRAELTITAGNVNMKYGDSEAIVQNQYGYSVTGITNGDAEEKLFTVNGYTNEGFDNNGHTKDVSGSPYDLIANVTHTNADQNYEVKVVEGDVTIQAKTLELNDVVANIVYGSNNGFVIDNQLSLKDGGVVYGDDVTLTFDNPTATGKYEVNRDGRVTADVGRYEDSLEYANVHLNGDKAGNYQLAGVTTTGTALGDITVTKADLVININDATTTYGTAFNENKYGYTFGTNGSNGLVNGDSQAEKEAEIKAIINNVAGGYNNSAAIHDTSNPNKVTADAGTHKGAVSFANDKQNIDNALGNYNIITVNNGNAIVDKATLNVKLNDITMTYGDAEKLHQGSYGYNKDDVYAQLVNGDSSKYNSIDDLLSFDYQNTGYKDGKTQDVGGKYYLNASNSNLKEQVVKDSAITSGVSSDGNYQVNITSGNVDIKAKKLTLNDIVANIVYGSKDGFVIDKQLSLKDGGVVYGDDVTLTFDSPTATGKYETNRDGRFTADVGTYEDSFEYANVKLNGAKAGNYELEGLTSTGTALGDIKVKKADLVLDINDVTKTYGTAFNAGEYGYTFGHNGSNGLVNGDSQADKEAAIKAIIDNGLQYNNSAAKDGANGVWTDNAGTHEKAIGINKGTADLTNALKNYNVVTINNGDAIVSKAKIVLTVNSFTIKYGDNAPTYGYSVTKDAVNGDKLTDLLGHVVYDTNGIKDNGRTNNVGSYYIMGQAVAADGSNLSTNYKVQVNKGMLKIDPAELTVTLNDVVHIYGSKELREGYAYGIKDTDGWAYDEKATLENKVKLNSDSITDGALTGNTTGKVTKDANKPGESYTWIAETLANTALGNYNISVVKGNSTVEKAKLTIVIDTPEPIKPGDKVPDFTGSKIEDKLTNGDYFDYEYGVKPGTDLSKDGNHTIGIIIDGKYYDTDSSLNNSPFLSDNYEYTITTGDLTVKAPDLEPEPVPARPDIWEAEDKYPWYQWDKQRNERERKAEVHFVDGGMAIH